jgi:hypothetical protein
MTTSGTTHYTETRDQIISRALRIVGGLGQGETPTTTQITESAFALNDLAKELEADGMPLWKQKTLSFPLVVGTSVYTIGSSGQTITAVAPIRMVQAWVVNSSNYSRPVNIITRSQYDILGDKTASGIVNQVWYDPPGAIQSSGEMVGTLTTYQVTNIADTFTCRVTLPFEDFDNSTDVPDFPTYWNNAIVWGLAFELSFEYGVGLSERGMIDNNAKKHHLMALSYGTEEGSLYLQPHPQWDVK